jgi:hypothetical protein
MADDANAAVISPPWLRAEAAFACWPLIRSCRPRRPPMLFSADGIEIANYHEKMREKPRDASVKPAVQLAMPP